MKRFALLLALLLPACGLRAPLEPAPGHAMPPTPAMAARPLTTDQLVASPTNARPDRVDEPLRRSEEREGDRFDLPPGDVPVDSNTSADPPK